MSARSQRSLSVWILALALASCGQPTPPVEPSIVYREVKVPVAVGCVSQRPTPPVAANARISADQWAALAPGAQAEVMKAQAGEHMNYEDKLNAATSGCKDAPSIPPAP